MGLCYFYKNIKSFNVDICVPSSQVERRAEGAGLGMKGSRKRGTSDSYRVAVKQAAQQRFKEIQEAEQFN